MELPLAGIVQPDGKVGLHRNLPNPIQGHHVKFPNGFIEFRRIPRRYHHPARRQTMGAEGLVLQELKHGRGQGFRHTVDLVQKQNALRRSRPLHGIVNRSDDLAHGVFRHGDGKTAVALFHQPGQADGALPGVMGQGVGHQIHGAVFRRLLQNGGFADAGRPHQQQWPLVHRRKQVLAFLVLLKIGPHRADDFFFRFLNVHSRFLDLKTVSPFGH